MKWEYMHFRYISADQLYICGDNELAEVFTEYIETYSEEEQLHLADFLSLIGRHGWELVSVYTEPEGSYSVHVNYIFKRPVQ
jgi:hypothetical protein